MKRASPLAALAAGLLAGCATTSLPPAPQPFSAEQSAARLDARSLRDPALAQFLAENLGAAPAAGAAWDFETFAWAAFYYHPSLAVARAQWQRARAEEQTANARPNPTVSLAPGYNSSHDPGISPWFPAINFDFLLQSRAKRTHQADVSRAESEAARLGVLAAAWQVRTELRRALADLAHARQRETVLRTQTDLAQKLLSLLEQRRAAGRIGSIELSAARVTLLNAEAAAADARAQAVAAHVRVAAALGLSVAALEGVELPVPPLTAPLASEALAVARRQSLQSRADVLAALAHYESAQAALELEAAKQQPDVHLGPGYQWDQGANKWSLALTFELPIFHRNEGPIAVAVAHRAEAAAQFLAAQAQAIAAIDTAAAAQAAAAAQLVHTQHLRDESRRQSSLAQQRLTLGAADQVEVSTARLDAAAVELALLDAETAAALAAGQLEDALQIPFPRLAALTAPAR